MLLRASVADSQNIRSHEQISVIQCRNEIILYRNRDRICNVQQFVRTVINFIEFRKDDSPVDPRLNLERDGISVPNRFGQVNGNPIIAVYIPRNESDARTGFVVHFKRFHSRAHPIPRLVFRIH